MDHLRAIICILISAGCAVAQPFTEGELGWANRNCDGTVSSGNIAYVIAMNTPLTNILVGAGSAPFVFSASQPDIGSDVLYDNVTGSNVYTPSNNFIGNDGFDYTVSLARCPKVNSLGRVDISVITNFNDVGCLNFSWTNTYFNGTYCLPPDAPCVGAGLILLAPFNTNQNWTMSFTDSMGLFTATNWTYVAGSDPNSWNPPLVSLGVNYGVGLFCSKIAGGGNCVAAYGDVEQWSLCGSVPCVSNNIVIAWGGTSSSSGGTQSSGSASTIGAGAYYMTNNYSAFTTPSFYQDGGTATHVGDFTNHYVTLDVTNLFNNPSPGTNTIYISVGDSGGQCLATNFAITTTGTTVFPFNLNADCATSNSVTVAISSTNYLQTGSVGHSSIGLGVTVK